MDKRFFLLLYFYVFVLFVCIFHVCYKICSRVVIFKYKSFSLKETSKIVFQRFKMLVKCLIGSMVRGSSRALSTTAARAGGDGLQVHRYRRQTDYHL